MELTKNYWKDRRHPDTGKQYKPEAIVLHITDSSYYSALNWIKNPASQVSYHYLIHDGEVDKLVDEKHAAWANGKMVRPTWKGVKVENGKVVNPNLYTISIAVASKGEIPTWKNWVSWVKLCKEVVKKYDWTVNELQVVNHFEINALKSCPKVWFSRFYLKLLIKYF